MSAPIANPNPSVFAPSSNSIPCPLRMRQACEVTESGNEVTNARHYALLAALAATIPCVEDWVDAYLKICVKKIANFLLTFIEGDSDKGMDTISGTMQMASALIESGSLSRPYLIKRGFLGLTRALHFAVLYSTRPLNELMAPFTLRYSLLEGCADDKLLINFDLDRAQLVSMKGQYEAAANICEDMILSQSVPQGLLSLYTSASRCLSLIRLGMVGVVDEEIAELKRTEYPMHFLNCIPVDLLAFAKEGREAPGTPKMQRQKRTSRINNSAISPLTKKVVSPSFKARKVHQARGSSTSSKIGLRRSPLSTETKGRLPLVEASRTSREGAKNLETWFQRLVGDVATIFELANAVIANRLGRLSTLVAKASRIRVVQKHRNRFTGMVLCLYAETLLVFRLAAEGSGANLDNVITFLIKRTLEDVSALAVIFAHLRAPHMIIVASELFIADRKEESKAFFTKALAHARDQGDKLYIGIALTCLCDLFEGTNVEALIKERTQLGESVGVTFTACYMPMRFLIKRAKGITSGVQRMRTRAFSKGHAIGSPKAEEV